MANGNTARAILQIVAESEDAVSDLNRLADRLDALDAEQTDIDIDTSQLRGAAEALDKTAKKAKDLGAFAGGSTSGLDKMLASLTSLKGALGALGIAVAAKKLLELGAAAVRVVTDISLAADRIERLRNALGGLLGTERSLEVLKNFRDISNELGVNFDGVRQRMGRLLVSFEKLGFSGQTSEDIMLSLLTAVQGTGGGFENLSGIMKAFEDSAAKGRIQAEELRNQLGDRLPAATVILADQLGVTTAELQKMLERGEVLASTGLPALAAGMIEAFGPAAQANVRSLDAELNRVRNRVDLLTQAFGKGLNPIVKELLISFQGLDKVANFDAAAESLGRDLAEPLERLGGFLDRLQTFKEAETFTQKVGAMSAVVLGFSSAIQDAADNYPGLFGSTSARQASQLADILQLFAESELSVAENAEAMGNSLERATDRLKAAVDVIGNRFAGALERVDAAFKAAFDADSLEDFDEELDKARDALRDAEIAVEALATKIKNLEERDGASAKLLGQFEKLKAQLDGAKEKVDALNASFQELEAGADLSKLAEEFESAFGDLKAPSVGLGPIDTTPAGQASAALRDALGPAFDLQDAIDETKVKLRELGEARDDAFAGGEAGALEKFERKIRETEAALANLYAQMRDDSAVKAFSKLQEEAAAALAGVTEETKSFGDEIIGKFKEIVLESEAFANVFQKLGPESQAGFQAAIDNLLRLAEATGLNEDKLTLFEAELARLAENSGPVGQQLAENLISAFESSRDPVQQISDRLRELATGAQQVATAAGEAGGQVQKIVTEDGTARIESVGGAAKTAAEGVAVLEGAGEKGADKIANLATAAGEAGTQVGLLAGAGEEGRDKLTNIEGAGEKAKAGLEAAGAGAEAATPELEKTARPAADIGKAFESISTHGPEANAALLLAGESAAEAAPLITEAGTAASALGTGLGEVNTSAAGIAEQLPSVQELTGQLFETLRQAQEEGTLAAFIEQLETGNGILSTASEFLAAFAEAGRVFVEDVAPEFPEAGDKAAEGLRKITEERLLADIERLQEAVASIGEALEAAAKAASGEAGLVAAIGEISGALDDLKEPLGEAKKLFGELVDAQDRMVEQWEQSGRTALEDQNKLWKDITESVAEFVKRLREEVPEAAGAMADAVVAAIDRIDERAAALEDRLDRILSKMREIGELA